MAYKVTGRTITVPTGRNVRVRPVYESVGQARNAASFNIPIEVTLAPGQTPEQTFVIEYPFSVTSSPVLLNVSGSIIQLGTQFLDDIFANYIDENYELKTLVNFGNDNQSVIINKRYGPKDQTEVNTLQVKLLKPLSEDVGLGDVAFISRELSNTVIDTVKIQFAPELDNTPYLRPANTSVKVNKTLGKTLSSVTLKMLGLETGSVGGFTTSNNVSFEDSILRRWYSYDFNSAELNIDFSNYENFVFYGSATMRLESFKQKLKKIEKLTQESLQFEGNVFTGSLAAAGPAYIVKRSAELAVEKENIIRSFDRYEQHLYFTPSGSNLPYEAEVDYTETGEEYNALSYWPKNTNNQLYAVDSPEAGAWYSTQLEIAQRFDEFNENNLVNTIPNHVLEDTNSSAYITFIAMIGHFFDTVKPYIDQFPNIYSRNLSPSEELSKDLVVDVAQSVGFQLPTVNSIYNLSDNIIGSNNEVPRREFTVETHKRLLHNLPYFVKSKGTKTAINTLLRSFGISESLINIKEIGKSVTSSLYVFDEYTNGLDFAGIGSRTINIPLSSSLRNPRSIQLNFSTTSPQSMRLLRGVSGSQQWTLDIAQHPEIPSLGRIELRNSAEALLLTSSYSTMFDDNLYSVSLRTYDTGSFTKLDVYQVDGEDIVFSSSMQDNVFVSTWDNTQTVSVGGTGSGYNIFEGTVDEIRVWGINLSDEMVLNNAFDPGSNSGNDFTDAADWLYVQLSFNVLDTGSLATNNLLNETVYKNIANAPSLQYLNCIDIDSTKFSRYVRTVRQILPEIGGNGYVTKKIKVSEPAVPKTDSNGVPTLSRTESMVSVTSKQRNIQLGKSKIVIANSPSEIQNQNIIRTIGLTNINAAIGSPTELYKSLDANLKDLQEFYNQYYRVEVDPNKYTRIVSAVTSVLTDVIDYFIPARATLSTGVVIEPTILERTKIKPIQKIRFYGKGTRKTINAVGSLSSSKPDYEASFNFEQNIDTTDLFNQSATLPTYTASIDELVELTKSTFDSYMVNVGNLSTPSQSAQNLALLKKHLDWYEYQQYSSSNNPWPAISIGVIGETANKVGFNDENAGAPGAEPFNRLYSRKLFDYEINTTKTPYDAGLYLKALYEIPPSCDFRDLGTYTYFNKDSGIYTFPEIRYVPSYRYPIRASWDFEQQDFTNVQLWEYGKKYVAGDVVKQVISTEQHSSIFDEQTIRYAKKGNNRYYVFKANPENSPVGNGISWYSGSVPSYIPPSVDNDKWQTLRFQPVTVYVPKRVVFDTFRNPNIVQTNFRTTNINPNIDVDRPARYVNQFRLGNLSENSFLSGELVIQNILMLYAAQLSSDNIRLRLYRTQQDMVNDGSRGIEVYPPTGQGLLLDTIVTSGNAAKLINPILTLVAGENPPFGKIYYRIDNLENVLKPDVDLFLYYYAVEIEQKAPRGYLKKHYRFFRDNSTATKRRNWEGCKNTIDTTIDGLHPVQIFLTEGTQTTVSPTKTPGRINPNTGGILTTNGNRLRRDRLR